MFRDNHKERSKGCESMLLFAIPGNFRRRVEKQGKERPAKEGGKIVNLG